MFRKTNDISFVELENKFDTNIEIGMNEGLPWDAFKDILSECERRESKEGPAFIPVTFKDKKEWVLSKGNKPSHRNEDNVKSISMIVLDLDQEGAFEKAKEFFSEFEYVIYSTHSYSKDEPYKLRIVLPLENEISPEDWRKSFDSLKHCIDADKQCGDLSRCYYFSSMNPDSGIEPYYKHNEGSILSLSSLNKATKKYIGNLSAEDKLKIEGELKKDLRKKSFVVERKHFSGGGPKIAQNLESGRKINKGSSLIKGFSYETCKQNFKNQIKQLQEIGSNDKFALNVTGIAVKEFGKETNMEAIIQFIVRASMEYYDPEHILSSSSDTLQSVPKKITGAIALYNEQWSAELSGDYHNYLNACVAEARARGNNNDWNFPNDIVELAVESTQEVGNDYSESSMRRRFKSILIDYSKNIDTRTASNLMEDIISQEIRQNPDDFNVNKVSEFTFLQLERLYQKKYSLSSKDEILNYLENDFNDVISNKSGISNNVKMINSGFEESWLNSAFRKGFACSKGLIKRTIELESNTEHIPR